MLASDLRGSSSPAAGRRTFVTKLAALVGLLVMRDGRADVTVHHVAIRGLKYVPDTLTVRRGDAVVWTNDDPFPHTVTAPGAFDSGSIEPGGSWRLATVRVGAFAYVCTLHSNMKGTMRVM